MFYALILQLLKSSTVWFAVTFKRLSGSAAAQDQLFSTSGADIVLSPGKAMQMVYRSSNWLMWML